MRALIVVDVQNDFLPGGALGIDGADEIVPLINRLMNHFPLVVASQDWHPPHHVSFASRHHKKVGERIEIDTGFQILWPDHCLEESIGADFPKELAREKIEKIFHKGIDPSIDSYSAFFDNAKKRSTGLHDYLHEKGVTEVFLCGLATDYCVFYSTLDALDLGYFVNVIVDACRGVNIHRDDSLECLKLMEAKGAKLIESKIII